MGICPQNISSQNRKKTLKIDNFLQRSYLKIVSERIGVGGKFCNNHIGKFCVLMTLLGILFE